MYNHSGRRDDGVVAEDSASTGTNKTHSAHTHRWEGCFGVSVYTSPKHTRNTFVRHERQEELDQLNVILITFESQIGVWQFQAHQSKDEQELFRITFACIQGIQVHIRGQSNHVWFIGPRSEYMLTQMWWGDQGTRGLKMSRYEIYKPSRVQQLTTWDIMYFAIQPLL